MGHDDQSQETTEENISKWHCTEWEGEVALTFARTLSNEGGLTIEKQIKNTSVCGYESGRKRS
jgi:hypothetical protein